MNNKTIKQREADLLARQVEVAMSGEKTKSMSLLDLFHWHGIHASIHYADDTTKEWGMGNWHKRQALAIFDLLKKKTETEDALREIAKQFLWSLDLERPTAKGEPR